MNPDTNSNPRLLADGSIDYEFYCARARVQRSNQFFETFKWVATMLLRTDTDRSATAGWGERGKIPG